MKITFSALASAFLLLTCSAAADEGLYLYTNPPRQQLKERHQFVLSNSFLEKLQKASLFFEDGSASFVSANGLILTNQHVGWRWLEELSTPERDLVRDGFYAKEQKDEICCAGLTARLPWSFEDVTARVHAAIKPEMTAAQASKARSAVVRAIETESSRDSKLFSQVVAMDHGSRYQLYRYKEFKDIRLVFAPEQEVLRIFDVCFFRAYEDGKPVQCDHFLRFANGPGTDELVLVSGFPGSTSRFLTVADLESYYGRRFFLWFKHLSRWHHVLAEFCQESPENDRLGRHELFGIENECTAELSLWCILEKLLAEQRRREQAFVERAVRDPQLGEICIRARARIAAAFKDEEHLETHFFLEHGAAFNSELFHYARQVLRLTDESAKSAEDCLPEYGAAQRGVIEREMLAPKSIPKELEILKLADSLSLFASRSRDAELTAKILAGKSPADRARELVMGSRLDDLAVRKALLAGGKKAVAESTDTMLALARLVDPRSRQVRAQYEETVSEPCAQAYTELAKVRAKLSSAETYPDASGSLRLSFGKVEPRARMYASTKSGITTVRDVFEFVEVSEQAGRLPSGWQKARQRLLYSETPLLFSTSADAVSGNSGSPVVNRDGKLLGVCSIGSKGQELQYEEGKSGSGAVAIAGILEMLDHAYDAKRLVSELHPGDAPKLIATGASLPSLPPLPPTPSGFGPFMPMSMRVVHESNAPRYPKELVPALIGSLKDADAEVVQAAALGLSNLGREALPALIESLQAKESVLRANAAVAIARMGPRGHDAVPALLKCLQDGEVNVRREAARALAAVVEAPPALRSAEEEMPMLPIPPPLMPLLPGGRE